MAAGAAGKVARRQEAFIRLFLAADIDDDARTTLAAWMAAIADGMGPAAARAIKWVEPANLHLTLHFFGEVSDEQRAPLLRALAQPLAAPVVPLRLQGAGTFPRAGPPRILWIGIAEGATHLTRVHAELQDRLRPLGFADPPDARPFALHLTVGRVRTPRPALGRTLRAALERHPAPHLPVSTVDRVTLYQSRLSARGSTYVPQAIVELSGRGRRGC